MTSAIVVRAPAGLGKTTQVLDAIAQAGGGSVEIYVPTHQLAEEVGTKLRGANPRLGVTVIGGRSHAGTDGKPLCKEHKLAEATASAGGEVYSSLCAGKDSKDGERCRHYDSCPYIAQFKHTQVTIYPHAYLPLPRMRLEPAVPELAVIDESFFQACIDKCDVPISLLRASFLGPEAQRVCEEIEIALINGLPLLRHLVTSGVSLDNFHTAVNEMRRGAPSMSPGMTRKARAVALLMTRERSQLLKLLTSVRSEILSGRAESHGLTYSAGIMTVHTKKTIRRFQERDPFTSKLLRESRVLIIDANADAELVGQFFDVTVFSHLQTERRAKVIQCRSMRCSKTSLVPERNTDPKSERTAKRRLREMQRFLARLATQHPRVLVVGPQEITGNPNANIKPLIKVPANVDLAHFNAIRGIDRWKDHDAVVVIGRNEPRIEALEAIARSVFLTDREPLQFVDEWAIAVRGYRLKHGAAGVEVVVHPDPRAQAILEQLREGESQQAIDRLRLIHAATPKTVYLLSNVVLDVDVDQLMTWEELMNGGGRVEQAWNMLPGVMPLAPAWLATQFPRLWNTADAAKADVRRGLKECQFTNMITISNSTLFQHQYRPAAATSQRAWSRCLSSNPDPEAARAPLETLVGAVTMRPPKAARPARPPRKQRSSKAQSTKTQNRAPRPLDAAKDSALPGGATGP